MAKFTDASGRDWDLQLTVDSIRRVRGDLGFDLAKLFTPERLGELGDDVVLQVDVLAALTVDQRTQRGVSNQDFAAGMRGQPLEDAMNALTEAAVDFLPRSRAQVMTRVKNRAMELQTAMLAAVVERVEALTIEDLRRQTSFGAKSSD